MVTGTTKPRQLQCCCCGADAGIWQQHWNRDTGYGVCPSCVNWLVMRGTTAAELKNDYGIEGVNYAPKEKPSE